MPAPIHVRTDFTPDQLRAFADTLTDQAHARRARAIAAVLEGRTRTEAARIGGMERQTLRDWVHRFNSDGLPGLKSLRSPGRPPKLTAEQTEELASIIAGGPAAFADGIRRWRLADLVTLIRTRFGVEHDEVSVGRIMRRLGYEYSGVEWRPVVRGAGSATDGAPPDEPREAASAIGSYGYGGVVNC